MGWFDILIGAANTGANLYNASQVEALRRQGAEAALIHAITMYLREQIFTVKQMADWGLAQEAYAPKIAAGALSIAALRLQSSGVTPDLFLELGDKEYASQTIRLVTDNKRRLLSKLSIEDQNEVARVAEAGARLPDYNYYVSNYNNGLRLMKATAAVEKYQGRNGCASTVMSLSYVFIGLPAMVILFGMMIGWTAGAVIGFGAWLAGFVAIVLSLHTGEYKAAQKVVKELEGKINLPRFTALHQEFAGGARASQLQQQAQTLVSSFFGDARLLGA